MPRITVAAGPTNPAAGPGETGYIEPEPAAAAVGFRAEGGPEIELSDGTPVVPSDGGSVTAAGTDWASMTIVQLREQAKQRGLSPSGAKADLVARLAGHDAPTVDEADMAEEVSV